jgi:hypothetical protein
VTVSGEPCTPQLFPPVSNPMKSTLIGEDAAAVVGSTTTMLFPVAAGCPEVSAMVSAETSNGTTTNGTRFDSAGGFPGFWICTVSVPAAATSDGFNTVVHADVVAQVVLRAAPFIRIVDAALPLPATKCVPCTDSGKLSTAPAIALDGRITSIVGPLVTATLAEADFVGSAELVATTEIAFGDGATAGAEYRPPALTDPHADPAQPWPGTPLWTLHVTLVLPVPVTLAKNCHVLVDPPEAGTNAYVGEIATPTLPDDAEIVIADIPVREGSAWLVATSETVFGDGTAAGAR